LRIAIAAKSTLNIGSILPQNALKRLERRLKKPKLKKLDLSKSRDHSKIQTTQKVRIAQEVRLFQSLDLSKGSVHSKI
jgi:hypothetical protein